MRIQVDTLDDALIALYPQLLSQQTIVTASRGETAEFLGVLIEIAQPRARLSRSETRGRLFSSLGELLWYLSGDNRLDFIEPYISRYRNESEDGVTVYGGYGPQLFSQRGNNQIQNVINLLKTRPSSRRALLQIFNAEDIATVHKEVPCTATLQFFVRDNQLHLVVTMRSNDAFIGFPHDVFCFTMLQEIIARSIDVEIGPYRHFVGSLHLYKKNRESAKLLVSEGFQSRIEMPPMPNGDPWPSIRTLLAVEKRAKAREGFDADGVGLEPYWSDLAKLLQIFFSKDTSRNKIIYETLGWSRYRPYVASHLKSTGN